MALNVLVRENTVSLATMMKGYSRDNTSWLSSDDILVAIPAYNEEVAVGSVIARCKKYIDHVVVIDDGSLDHTAEVARLLGADVVAHEKNGGYGASIRTCFEMAKKTEAKAMVILDADGQHDPDYIPLLISDMERTGADIVIGSRFVNGNGKNIPQYRKVGMKVLDAATAIGAGVNISDSQSGFRLYSKRAIDAISLDSKGMAAGSEILIQAAEKKLKISEVPIQVRYDIKDTSSENPVSHGFSVLSNIIRMIFQKKPLLFFGMTGILLAFSGSIFIFLEARALSVYSDIAVVYGILGTFAISLGIILLILGIALEGANRMKPMVVQFLKGIVHAEY